MENSLSASDISLIYPEAVLADESGLVSPHALSRQSVSALELDFLIDLKTCDIGDFFTDDAETLKYRQETFRDLSENPGICPVLRRMVPFLTDITELRRLGSFFGKRGVPLQHHRSRAVHFPSVSSPR